MYALVKFDNGGLAIYPKKFVKNLKDYIVVRVKGCSYNASLITEHGSIELLESIKQDIEKKQLYIPLHVDQNLKENTQTPDRRKKDNSLTLIDQAIEHDNPNYASPVKEGFASPHSSAPASDGVLFPESPCISFSRTEKHGDIHLLKNVDKYNENAEKLSENIPVASLDRTRINLSTNATLVPGGLALPHTSDCISPAPAQDVLPSRHSSEIDQEGIAYYNTSFDAPGKPARRRLFENTSVAHTMAFQNNAHDQTSASTSAVTVMRRQKKPCKQHSCYFCGLLFTNLRKHWRRKHADEPIFQEALKNIGNKKNHTAFETLRKMGDEKYNNSTDSTKFITVRDSRTKTQSDYLLCEECHGYYVNKNYARHRKLYCSKNAQFGYGLLGKARVATYQVSKEAHPLLVKNIFPYLTKEKQRDVILKDPAAIIMGNILSEEQLSKPDPGDLYKYVSHQLRLLADIFNIASALDPEIAEIDDLFHPNRYETVVQAIKRRGQFEHGIYKAPCAAMGSCTILSKLCRKLKSIALSMDNETDYKRYDRFESLLREQQNTNVTKLAAAARIAHRRKKVEVLPSTTEVNALFQTLEKECKTSLDAAKNNLTIQSYGRLAKAIAARIMVMNRRRPGDVHKTTLGEYKNLTRAEKGFLTNLSDRTERDLAANLCRFVTKGKLNKSVANLITNDMVETIDFLIAHRVEVGISEDNKYVFANPKAKRAPFFRADDALKSICNQYGLPYSRLSATKLRKHFATTTANMDQNTQKIISDFMGHSYNIHQNIYQIRQVQTDVSVMGRILYDASGIYCSDKPLTTPITSENVTSSIPKPSWLDECDDDAFGDSNNDEFEARSTILCHTSSSDEESASEDQHKRILLSQAVTRTKHIHKKQKSLRTPIISKNSTSSLSKSSCDTDAMLDNTNNEESDFQNTVIEYTSKSNKESGPENQHETNLIKASIPLQKSQATTDLSVNIHKKKCYKIPFSISSYKMSNFRPSITSRTWRTPDKKNARTIFQEYIQNEDVPTLNDIQEILTKQPATINKNVSQIQSWIRAEIQRNKRQKDGYVKERWTTPQKKELRRHFHGYYKTTKETGRMTYPPLDELQEAVQNIPDLRDKTPALIRSKLQNEYRNLSVIQVSETSDDSAAMESDE